MSSSDYSDGKESESQNDEQIVQATSGNRWRSLKNLFRRERRISIIVDGPNLIRRVGNKQIKTQDIDLVAGKLGAINERYICLNDKASDKFVEAMLNSGYQPIVVQGDIYVRIAMKAMEIANRKNSHVILFGSRDARIVPIMMKLKEKGIETAIVGFDPGFSIALKNVADFAFELN